MMIDDHLRSHDLKVNSTSATARRDASNASLSHSKPDRNRFTPQVHSMKPMLRVLGMAPVTSVSRRVKGSIHRHDAALQGEGDGFGAVGGAEFCEEVLHVGF